MINEDHITKILEVMPEKIDGGDIVDVIVSIIECYNMRHQWLEIATCVGFCFHKISEREKEKANATHH